MGASATSPNEQGELDELYAALVRMGLMEQGERPRLTPLTGGVSSDIVRVDVATGSICLKRALPQLRVAATWYAPVERNSFEVEWIRVAAGIVPHSVPSLVGVDTQAGLFAMTYLDPYTYPIWKEQLRDGVIHPETAQAVAACLVQIHAGTAHNDDIANRFATDHIFHSIRIEPYLLATAQVHPECADRLHLLADRTATTKCALVHGDVSPKNILVGPRGPLLLDAECAWYGDPAFDVAFCLNHLLLKCVWRPEWREQYMHCFEVFTQTYAQVVSWEPWAAFERRVAYLLPGLLLGRIDGKSPVEYLTDEADRAQVRRVAISLLQQPVETLVDLLYVWQKETR